MSGIRRVLTVSMYICITLILLVCADSCTNRNPDSQDPDNFSVQTEEYKKGLYTVSFTFPNSAVEYGNSIDLQLALEYPEGYTAELAPITGLTSLTVEISQTSPVITPEGFIKQDFTLTLEAYLPGTLLFPPVSILFHDSSTFSLAKPDINITTNSVQITVTSPFGEETDEKKLNAIIIPETPTGSSWILPTVIGLLLLIAAVLVIIIIKKKSKKSAHGSGFAVVEQTLEQMLKEFELKYLSENSNVDLREAFHLVECITVKTDWVQKHPEKYRYYLDLCRKARFSQKSYAQHDGIIQLREFFQEFTGKATP